mmetsp:Transcript_20000/g.46043  ORF Transcript_20000/g.46043 Transcript_20000/m.46043 type:complete len:155 (-) Transcript_20000:139-603(-)
MTMSAEDAEISWQEEENEETLFRHLLRFYALASVTDYYKPGGGWDKVKLKCDLSLIASNRHEAGAPEPLGLEDVEMPELPKPDYRQRDQSRNQARSPRRSGAKDGRVQNGRSRDGRLRSRSRRADPSRSRLGAVQAQPLTAREAVSATIKRRSL